MDARTSVATNYTTMTARLISQHAKGRKVESHPVLREATLRRSGDLPGRGFRLLSRQSKVTPGSGRKNRLYGWMYVHRSRPEDVIQAVLGDGGADFAAGPVGGRYIPAARRQQFRQGQREADELRTALENDPLYHVVIRGNDDRFCRPDDMKTRDAVTNYFVSAIEDLRDIFRERFKYVVEGCAETGEEPLEAFRDLMADSGFVGYLEEYYRLGVTVTDHNAKLAGRLDGDSCFLSKTIKHNHVDVLKELLEYYAPHCTARGNVDEMPWLRLAEPFNPVGKYKISAFHRAIWDGRAECLRVLLEYARKHGLDITQLRNRESFEWQHKNGGKEGMNLLEYAENCGKHRCYNLLAPFFGANGKAEDDDQGCREDDERERARPRIEVEVRSAGDSTVHKRFVVQENEGPLPAEVAEAAEAAEASAPIVVVTSWAEVIEEAAALLRTAAEPARAAGAGGAEVDPWHCSILLKNIQLSTNPSAAEAEALVAALDGSAGPLIPTHCNLQFVVPDSGAAAFTFLKAVRRHDAALGDRRRAAARMWFVRFSPTPTTREEEAAAGPKGVPEAEVQAWISGLLAEMERDPRDFFNVVWSAPLSQMLPAKLSDELKSLTAALSRMSAPERLLVKTIRRKLAEDSSDNDALNVYEDRATELFLSSLALLPPIESLGLEFYNERRLQPQRLRDAREAMDPEAAVAAARLVRAWCRHWTPACRSWAEFCHSMVSLFYELPELERRLGANVWADVCELFRSALDKALESLLRMDVAFDHAYQRRRARPLPYVGREAPAHFVRYMLEVIPEGLLRELPLAEQMVQKLVPLYDGLHTIVA